MKPNAKRRCAAFFLSFFVIGAAGCDRPGNVASEYFIAAPSHSIGVAALDEHRIAVLAGTPEARGIFIIRVPGGDVERSFGVTGGAHTIVAATKDGPLYLGVGTEGDFRSVGALETWTLDGKKKAVAPLPAAALASSSIDGGRFLVLVGSGGNRAIVPIDAADGKPGKPIPMPANVNSVDWCTFTNQEYLLLTVGPSNAVELSDLHAKHTQNLNVTGTSPQCEADTHLAYVLQPGLASKSVAVLAMPSFLQAGVIGAPVDAVALAKGVGGGLLVVSSAGSSSNIRMLSQASLDLSKVATNAQRNK